MEIAEAFETQVELYSLRSLMSKAAGTDACDVQRPKISLLLKMFMKADVVKWDS